jgi:hypothetical protein
MQDGSSTTGAAPATGSSRKRIWMIAKWIVFAVIMYFIAQRAHALWQKSPAIEVHVDVRWLIPAALFYLVGWLPSAWFWRALMVSMDQRPGWYESVRAYLIGHLGKYVPGKALVLVIRGSLMKDAGVNPVLAGLTAAYETLVSMSAGAAIAVALAPMVIPDSLWERLPSAVQFLRNYPLLVPILVAVAAAASTPFSAYLFTRAGRRAMRVGDVLPTARITAGLMLQGLAITSLGWVLHACSLGCALQAISDKPVELSQFPVWLASVSLSTFAGFIILVAPGGIGVREWVLIEILKDQPNIGADMAMIVAGLLRLVWFAAELAIAGILYVIKPARRSAS